MTDFLQNLKQKFSDMWLRLSVNVHETVNREGPHILYAFAVVAALSHVLASNSYNAFHELLTLLGGIGTNLLANRLGSSVDKDQLPELLGKLLDKLKGLDDMSAARVAHAELQKSLELRETMDHLLEKVEALTLAQYAFNEKHTAKDERDWFAKTMQQALHEVGSRLHIEAHVSSSEKSAVSTGQTAVAATTGAVAVGKIEAQTVQISTASVKEETQGADIEQRYFEFVRREHGPIKLFGFLSQANIDVRLLDVFVSLRFSEHWRELEMKRLPAIEERDDRALNPQQVLTRAIQKQKSLLILGGPGSGKTTLLKYFAVCCLDSASRARLDLKKPLIPIVVPLRQIDPTKPFTKALAVWAKANNQNITPDRFEAWLHGPGSLVLLDGLDEVSDLDTRRQVCNWIDRAAPAYGQSTFVVTCRFTGYREAEGVALQIPHVRADMLDLNPEQQGTFLRQWFRAAQLESLEEHEACDPERRQEIDREAATQAAAMMEFLGRDENRSLRDMARIPVLLQIMAIIWKEQGSLSGERVELYNRSIDFLLDHRDRSRKPPIEPLMSAAKARLVLRPLALWMQAEWQKDEAPRQEIEKHIAAKLQEVRPDKQPIEFLENIRDRAGVLVGAGADTYTFQHKSFREFLAAIEIANHQKVDLLVENFGKDWWQETLLFAAGLTSPEIFPEFIESLLKHDKNAGPTSPLLLQLVREAAAKPLAPFEKILRNQKLAWQKRYNALQCVRLLPSQAAKDLVMASQRDKEPKVRQLSEQILIEWDVVRPPVAAGEKPDRFFNPFEENAEYILIPGAKERVVFESTGKPAPDYPIYFAKYPVTNKLYRRFIDYLAEGKSAKDLLSSLPRQQFDESLLARAKEMEGFLQYAGSNPGKWAGKLRSLYDDDKRFNGDDQPVVGVTWYAAMAYCHWLSELQKANGKKKTENSDEKQNIFRLPTEEEWEWAASGGTRIYPWSDDEPDDTRANYGQKVGHTTPVGAYAAGATPEGLMDMAGNVWEWMENLYGKGAYWPEARALRGGSWNDTAEVLRCAARVNLVHPVNVWHYDGFRVVRGQS